MQRLMLIENDDGFTSIFRRYFTAGGYEVVTARSVEESLAKWRAGPPALVVASCHAMADAGPRVGGALRRQAEKASVPVVASGTWADTDLLAEATASWAADSFSRPCHPERIWDIVRRFLGHVEAPRVKIDSGRFTAPKPEQDRPLEWSDRVLEDIEYLMYEVTGNLVKTRERLVNQIEKRMREREIFKLAEYDALLRHDPDELAELVGLVTVNETYFFRNPEQFNALRDRVLPQLAEQKRDRTLLVWSAACSVGAEPYSIAMLSREVLPGWKVRLVGSDIDTRALDAARLGSYTNHMAERTPLEYKGLFERYARRRDDGTWQVAQDILEMVTFKRENILESKAAGFDLAFCRNVMIYFDQANIARMVGVLTNAVRPGGIVAVGDTEYIACATRDLERLPNCRSTYFVRNGRNTPDGHPEHTEG
jgi:chemotaxis protein methyltransferase CheR